MADTAKSKPPFRLLFMDIETRPNLAYVWQLYQQDVSPGQLVEEHEILCFAAKWGGEHKIQFWSERRNGQAAMIRAAHRLLDEADVVVSYNGKSFDEAHLNRKFLQMEMAPPSPFEHVDLIETMKRRFRFASNKLEHIAPALGLGGKVEHEGFRLWRKVMENDAAAWERMMKYNLQDVELLVKLYGRLKAWVPGHPTRTLYDAKGTCPICSSARVQHRGEAHTRLGVYQRFQCQGCGAWLRGAKRVRGTDLRGMA